MGKLDNLMQKWKKPEEAPRLEENVSVWKKICNVIGAVFMWLYRLRSVFLAAPVVIAALKLASYNLEHLPEQVGVNLQASGEFATMISRELAVMCPLGVTAACLVLMFVSRKALYPWAISVFTLVLPVLLLLSNQYPA